jgi:hypothetical protein
MIVVDWQRYGDDEGPKSEEADRSRDTRFLDWDLRESDWLRLIDFAESDRMVDYG